MMTNDMGVIALSETEMTEIDGGLLGAILVAAAGVALAVGAVYLIGYGVGYVMNS